MSKAAVPACPDSLRKVRPYLEQARTRKTVYEIGPVLAYYCNLYALEMATAEMGNLDNEGKAWVLAMMDQMESDKKALGGFKEPSAASKLLSESAKTLFDKADRADRALDMSLETAKDFKAAMTMYTVAHKYSGAEEKPAEELENIVYAKDRFVEICAAAKQGRAPQAPPPRAGEEEEQVAPPEEVAAVPPAAAEEGSSSASPQPPGLASNASFDASTLPSVATASGSGAVAAAALKTPPATANAAAAEDDAAADAGAEPEAPLYFPAGHTPSRAALLQGYRDVTSALAALELQPADTDAATDSIATTIAVLTDMDPEAYRKAARERTRRRQQGGDGGNLLTSIGGFLGGVFGAPPGVAEPKADSGLQA